jgi:hypothetical protein
MWMNINMRMNMCIYVYTYTATQSEKVLNGGSISPYDVYLGMYVIVASDGNRFPSPSPSNLLNLLTP